MKKSILLILTLFSFFAVSAQGTDSLTVLADKGVVTAQFNLGLMYKTGIGVAPDLEKAKYWLKLAAEQGDKEAIQELNNI